MLNMYKKMADVNNKCDSIAAVAQIALFAMHCHCRANIDCKNNI